MTVPQSRPQLPFDRLLTARQVAAVLGCTLNWVYKLSKPAPDGAPPVLPPVRVGKLVRFRPEQVQAFIAKGGLPPRPRKDRP